MSVILQLGMDLKTKVTIVLWIHLIENFGLYFFLFLNLLVSPNFGGKLLIPYLETLENHVNLGKNVIQIWLNLKLLILNS